MDLKDFTPKSEVVVVEVLHPATLEALVNKDKSPMTIELYAPYSKEYKQAQHEQQNKRLQKAQKARKGGFNISSEELEKDGIELLAKVTKAWNVTYEGASPELSFKKAVEVYSELFWLVDQINEAMADVVDFTKN